MCIVMSGYCIVSALLSISVASRALMLRNIWTICPSVSWLVGPQSVLCSDKMAEMRMVRWMCDIRVKDRVPSKKLRERLGLDDIISVLQQTSCGSMCMCCKKKTMICKEMYGV